MQTTNVTAYRTSHQGRDYLFIFETEDSPELALLPTHLTDEQVVAICAACGWTCTEIIR
jgi:hypothetical protein